MSLEGNILLLSAIPTALQEFQYQCQWRYMTSNFSANSSYNKEFQRESVTKNEFRGMDGGGNLPS